MRVNREHYDVFRRAMLMILKHFDKRFGFRDHETELPTSIVWELKDFDLIRRASLMVLRHLEKTAGWQDSKKSHP